MVLLCIVCVVICCWSRHCENGERTETTKVRCSVVQSGNGRINWDNKEEDKRGQMVVRVMKCNNVICALFDCWWSVEWCCSFVRSALVCLELR